MNKWTSDCIDRYCGQNICMCYQTGKNTSSFTKLELRIYKGMENCSGCIGA